MREHNILKYCLCYLIEKQHRYVYDHCFMSTQDKNYRPRTIYENFRLFMYKFFWFKLVKDFRPYLRWWHETKKKDYIRYTKYEF